jgi:MFS family permease
MSTFDATVEPSLRDLLAQRRFMRYWVSRLTGNLANQMLLVAIAWQMYEITGSAWDLGLVGLYQFVPALLLTLVAGQVADRFNRGHIILACFVAQAVTSAVLWLAAVDGWLHRELLLVLSIVLGAARAFQMPAQQALLPLLVTERLFPRAMAFSAGGLQVSVMGGPALGGFLFAAGAPVVYGVCLGLMLLACGLMLRVKIAPVAPSHEPVTLETVLAGVVFVWRRKLLLGAISLDLFAVLLGGATALLPIYAKDILMVGPWGLGLLRAAPALGALVMSVVLTRWPLQEKVGRKLLASVAVFGVAIMVFAVSTSFWLSMAALALSGAADMVSVVIRQTLVQLETPDEMRGRVSAVNTIFIGASNQLGEFESGATAALMGPVAAALVGGVGTIGVALLWGRWFPSLARRNRLTRE